MLVENCDERPFDREGHEELFSFFALLSVKVCAARANYPATPTPPTGNCSRQACPETRRRDAKTPSSESCFSYLCVFARGTPNFGCGCATLRSLRLISSSLHFTTRREASINYMMQFLKSKDRDAVTAICDASVKVMTPDGTAEDKVLQGVIDDARRVADLKKEFRSVDFFDFSFLRKAREQLKGNRWRP